MSLCNQRVCSSHLAVGNVYMGIIWEFTPGGWKWQDLVGTAVTESNKSSRDERIVYRSLTEKEEEVDLEAAE